MMPFRAALLCATILTAPPTGLAPLQSVFSYTGAYAEETVPSGYDYVMVRMWAAGGGNGNWTAGAYSGAGGYVTALFPVTAGDTLRVEVPGGGAGAARNATGGAGGWPDGGPGGKGDAGCGGGGGSARFYKNGTLKAVAGGGGGSGGISSGAGAGGGTTGQSSPESNAGTGGTQSAGGVDSNDTGNANKTGRSIVSFPSARTGGYGSANGDPTTLSSDDGGGGGGGYWGGGGGGGDARSGGGGSGWTDSDATLVRNIAGFLPTPPTACRSTPTIGYGVNSGNNGAAVAGYNGRIELIYLSGSVIGTLGQTSGTTSYSSPGGYKDVIPVTMPAGGGSIPYLSVGIHTVVTTQRIRGVIYDATGSGGGPGALVAYTDDVTVSSADNGSMVPMLFNAPVVLTAGNYWIGMHTSTGVNYWSATGGPASTYKSGDTFSDGSDATFGTPGGTSATYIRIEAPYWND